MKKFLCIAIYFMVAAGWNSSSAQLLEKIKNKAKQRGDQKVDQTIDKGLDKAEDATKNKDKNKNDNDEDETAEKNQTSDVKTQTLKSYSKYDFVAGDKIVYAEDFSLDVVSEFPLKWNTNGSGEVVTIEGQPGKWLKMFSNTKYIAPYANKLPENYTVEFDLLLDFKESMRVPDMEFNIFDKKAEKASYRPEMRLFIAPQAGTYGSGNVQNTIDRFRLVTFDEKSKEYLRSTDQLNGELYNNKTKPVHIALWVQKERVRIWVNQLKIYDLPKALTPGLELSAFEMEMGQYQADNSNYSYYLTNLKVAVATPDTRNKLITEGKWSTTGILFDVNSDKIKPTSYGTLKEIATILSENADIKVKIIGHTDSDGDDAKNLDLSKKRAAAVKTALSKEFNIDVSRLETDGMGETKPVADNKTAEAKAQNRRVEFVKL